MSNAEERLLINLQIIAHVKPFERINAKAAMLSIDDDSWRNSFARWLRSDDRQSCIIRLNHIVDECRTTLRGNKANRPRLLNHLRQAIHGLVNLKRTYELDIPTAHAFELLIQNVQAILKSAGVDIAEIVDSRTSEPDQIQIPMEAKTNDTEDDGSLHLNSSPEQDTTKPKQKLNESSDGVSEQ